MPKHFLLGLSVLFAALLPSQAALVFSTGSAWKYFLGTREASSPDPAAWRAIGFDDSSWASGAAPVGYGEPDIVTTLPNSSAGGYLSVFLRKTFVLSAPTNVSSLQIAIRIDDGFVVWINGTEAGRYNVPTGNLAYNAVASAAGEPIVQTITVTSNLSSLLVAGTNVMAIHAFNASTTSSDLLLDASLTTTEPDPIPPTLAGINPAPGLVNSLTQVTVTFNENVQGVDAGDLRLNGVSAISVTPTGNDVYTFGFVQPAYGPVAVSWNPAHGIADFGVPPNSFNAAASGATWQYQLVDTLPPTVQVLVPPAGQTVRSLTRIEVYFSEAVAGVDAADLLINGSPSSNVVALLPNQYQFQFPEPPTGQVRVAWSPAHGIHDLAAVSNSFAGGGWTYTLDPNSAPEVLLITEFSAIGNTNLFDEDLDTPDWIEIHNAGNLAVNLNGWYLTDDARDLTQWRFPSTNLNPGAFLVVFASGKARAVSGRRLHTNFELDGNGEYLALVRPDGQTVAHAFASAFPPQIAGVSYGVAYVVQTATFLAQSNGVRWLVPSSAAALPADWASPTFSDGTWSAGQTGLGFDTAVPPAYGSLIAANILSPMRGLNASAFARLRFGIPVEEMPVLDRLTLRMKYDDGFVTYLNGVEVARRNAPTTPTWNSAATTQHPNAAALQFEDLDVTPYLGQLQEGENVLAIQGLNISASDGDFLILPELVGQTVRLPSEAYFAQPTPGATNSASYLGLVADTKFSVDRGFYSAPFAVEITTATPGAEIRYTTNGSPPSASSGIIYTNPITISRTTVLRAIATKPGYRSTDVDTQTYVFLSDVVAQSSASALAAGFLSTWSGLAADYEMDPRITSPNATQMVATMRSLPSLFVTTTVSNLFDANTGIYSHPTSAGVAWERPASLEMISTNGTTEFQVDCGLRIQGGYFRQAGVTHKHSLRVLFKDEYGAGMLRHDLFHEPDAVQEFDTFVLRAGANDGYAWNAAVDTEQFTRDHFGRGLQRATGHPAPHGLFVHLYLNGFYWGLYNLVERPNEDFSSAYFGGQPEQWDANNAGDIKKGDLQAWNAFTALVQQPANLANYLRLQGNNPDGTRNPAYPVYLDRFNYIDYMMVNIWGGNWDWPNKNFWFGRQRTADSTGFKFYTWDFENTMGNDRGRSPTNMVSPRAGIENSWVGTPHYYLKNNPEYRMDFADHVHRFFFNGGLLTPPVLTNRYRILADWVEAAIIGESARWGDDNLNPPQDQSDWRRERDWILGTYLRVRSDIVLQQFRSSGLYPTTTAPVFNQFGGNIPTGFPLTMFNSNAAGTIYFTLDGTDPRVTGGAVSGGALTYSGPVALNGSTRVKARVLSGGAWSALNQADFAVPDLAPLRITEIMYHPAPVSVPELAAGFTNADDFEFIELRNTGPGAISLAGISFVNGITFTFDSGILAAGERLVLVKNLAAFTNRYGASMRIGGVYGGNLNNGGERLRLQDAAGRALHDFSYSDGWYPTTDGFGFSLIILDDTAPVSLWESRSSWLASSAQGGSPGAANALPPNIPVVVVNELLSRPAPPDKVAVELANLSDGPANVSGWWLTDAFRSPKKFQLPTNTIIPVGGFVVFTEDDFNAPARGTNAFTFSPSGGEVRLFSADVNGELTGYYHGWDFGGADPGVSLGRHVNSVGGDQFVAQIRTTLGAANAGPRVGPLAITELMYHPPDVNGLDNVLNEFVEVRNVSTNAVPLFEPTAPNLTWQLKGGVDFVFPTNVTLAIGESLLLVSFDPVLDPAALAGFRNLYGVADTVKVLGPYSGRLNNDTDNVELKKPTIFSTGPTGLVQVDKVSYHDALPWPEVADGFGASLHRRDPLAYGNDPANWAAAAPSPSFSYQGGTPPTITTPPQSRAVAALTDVSFSVVADGTGPLSYQWLFNDRALTGATNATLVLTNLQLSQAGAYSVAVFNPGGSVVSTSATLTVLIPVSVTLQPQTQRVNPGTNVTFTVAATGSGTVIYQWRFNGMPIAGATTTNLTLTNVQLAQDGIYDVQVSDAISSAVSQPALLIVLVRPGIVQQPTPTNQIAALGDTVSISLIATGRAPLSFRWRKNNGAVVLTNIIAGDAPITFSNLQLAVLNGTNCVLTLSNLQLVNGGNYDVVVTNMAGGTTPATSVRANLTAVRPPTNQVAAPGTNVTFRAVVSLPANLTNRFVWQFNDTPLKSGTNATAGTAAMFTNDLVLTNVSAAQTGNYGFVLTNSQGITAAYIATLEMAATDSDSDGIPDSWTQQYFGHPTGQAGDLSRAGDDADGDGMSNGQEHLAGTDPTNPQSVLKIALQPAEGSLSNRMAFQFSAMSNTSYGVEFRNALATGNWSNLFNFDPLPTNRLISITNPITGGLSERYYRVVTPRRP